MKREREANEQSLGDVAHALGVWPYTVMRWESNKAEPRARHRSKLESWYPALILPVEKVTQALLDQAAFGEGRIHLKAPSALEG